MIPPLNIAGIRQAFGAAAKVLAQAYVRTIAQRKITNRLGDGPYLDRYYLMGGPSEDGTFADSPMTVCLHHFLASDEAGELHNHPWEQSVSFILSGGYSEERKDRESDAVCRRDFFPFSFNFIAADDFHRVDLIDVDCWSIFITTRKTQSWSFWNRDTGKTTPWREFIAAIRGISPDAIDDGIKRSEDIR